MSFGTLNSKQIVKIDKTKRKKKNNNNNEKNKKKKKNFLFNWRR